MNEDVMKWGNEKSEEVNLWWVGKGKEIAGKVRIVRRVKEW